MRDYMCLHIYLKTIACDYFTTVRVSNLERVRV
jgi:hypothetical protein